MSACRELDVAPGQALVVGDSSFDEQAAEAARTRFVSLGMGSAGSVKALPDVARLVLEGDGT